MAALAAPGFIGRAQADSDDERHGMSAFGDLKYPPDFRHFDYVDPNAPKGGVFSQVGSTRQYNQNFLTFNSLNTYILKGDGAQGMELTFATLMARAADEPDAMYGLAARAVAIAPDGLTYRFFLRPEARFHDGSRILAADVAFSLITLKEKGHPIIHQLLRDMTEVEAADEETVVVRFAEKRGRDVPLFVAGLPIFSRAYYATRSFDESTLEAPLGSGPYKVGRFEVGRYIEYERVRNWWGANLPVNVGQNNFDTVRYEFYRDRDVAFEGFTGQSYLFREEFTSRVWATRYDFPAIRDHRVKREVLPDETPSGAQGWFINTRRETFRHPKLREALIYAFDFEWTNKSLMYGSYQRTHSVFQNSDMMAKGAPSREELALIGAVSRTGSRRGVRRAVRAAGVGRLGPGPRAVAHGGAAAARGGIPDRKRAVGRCARQEGSDRIPDRRADVPAASHAVHQKPQPYRHRGFAARGRSGAVSGAAQ